MFGSAAPTKKHIAVHLLVRGQERATEGRLRLFELLGVQFYLRLNHYRLGLHDTEFVKPQNDSIYDIRKHIAPVPEYCFPSARPKNQSRDGKFSDLAYHDNLYLSIAGHKFLL